MSGEVRAKSREFAPLSWEIGARSPDSKPASPDLEPMSGESVHETGATPLSLGGLLGQIAADVHVRRRHVYRAERRDAVEGPPAVVRVADGVRLRLPAEGGIAREQEVHEWCQEPQLRVGLLDP